MKAHPSSPSSLHGSKVENPLELDDAMMESENLDQTTLSDMEIDESVTEKMTYDLLNGLVDQKERSGKQHLNVIHLQNLSPYFPQHAQSSEIPQTHTLTQNNRVLVDQFGNSFEIGQFRSNLAELDEKSVQNEKESVESEVRIEENKVKCVQKVTQVEEIVHDNVIKCTHSFTEKCHNTFITDYAPTQEEKCSTSFEKNCQITYQPMAFDEKVEICDEPLKKVCDDSITGEEVCRTEYETSCETSYKNHTVEQDEPVCEMVMEKKCDGVVVDNQDQSINGRRRRSIARIENGEQFTRQNENCEEWPVQKCTLEKKTVTKSTPETSCKKHPKKVCATSNCQFVKSEKTCREETRSLVQNIPSEDCDLEPRETCKLETVLVPRLVEKPNCVQVPKEICVEVKTNPRKVSKPVIKEWCYRPQDFRARSTKEALDLVLNKLNE